MACPWFSGEALLMPVTVRIPDEVVQHLANHCLATNDVLRYGIKELRGRPEVIAALREVVIKKPHYEIKVRLSSTQYYYLRSWRITPGSIVSWWVIEQLIPRFGDDLALAAAGFDPFPDHPGAYDRHC